MHQSEARPISLPRLRQKPPLSQRLLRLARAKPLGAVSALLLLLLVLVAVFAEQFSPYSPFEQHDGAALLSPDSRFLLGTDNLGRDMLSRIIWGARISLWVGLIAVGVGTGSGTVLGLVSGYWGGKIDLLIQRVMDAIMAFPGLILALAIMAVLGASITNAMLAIAVVIMPGASRVVRGAVLAVKENQYVDAARAIGCGDLRVLVRHILPNVAAPIIIIATVALGGAILTESSLSFLGLGTPPPNPSWGGMLSGNGRAYMMRAPWLAIFPGIAISLAIMAFNLLGDALRDVWDPRLRRS